MLRFVAGFLNGDGALLAAAADVEVRRLLAVHGADLEVEEGHQLEVHFSPLLVPGVGDLVEALGELLEAPRELEVVDVALLVLPLGQRLLRGHHADDQLRTIDDDCGATRSTMTTFSQW